MTLPHDQLGEITASTRQYARELEKDGREGVLA
jgi:hypothetical protein